MTYLTQSRRAYLEDLRATFDAAREWLVLRDVCDAAIVRIDALLNGAQPTLHDDLLAVLPKLTAILNRIERDDANLRGGVVQCQRAIERRVRGQPSQPSRRERWEVEGPQRARIRETVEG